MRDPQDPWADERAMTGPSADELWSTNRTRDVIHDCDLCDTHGLRDGLPCRHIDHAAAAARGTAHIRQIMGWTQRDETRDEIPSPAQPHQNRP